MLSLMFATEEELGYDPTIQRRLDPETDRVCFVYQVDGHYYKTQKAILDRRSLDVRLEYGRLSKLHHSTSSSHLRVRIRWS